MEHQHLIDTPLSDLLSDARKVRDLQYGARITYSPKVFIPLTIRKRNGRPKILPPADMIPTNDGGVDPHVLKAIAKAWSWRRKRAVLSPKFNKALSRF